MPTLRGNRADKNISSLRDPSLLDERVSILDSGNFLAVKMTDGALTEAGIPHFIIEYTKSGRSLEMPIAPSFGRGYRWQVSVSKEYQREAGEVLRLLPVDTVFEPNTPDDLPLSPKAERWRTIYRVLSAAAIVGMVLLFWLLSR